MLTHSGKITVAPGKIYRPAGRRRLSIRSSQEEFIKSKQLSCTTRQLSAAYSFDYWFLLKRFYTEYMYHTAPVLSSFSAKGRPCSPVLRKLPRLVPTFQISVYRAVSKHIVGAICDRPSTKNLLVMCFFARAITDRPYGITGSVRKIPIGS